jgi:hypothetical protein
VIRLQKNFAAGWQVEATEEENSMGDLVGLPICRAKKCSGEDCIRRASHGSSWT